MMLSEGGKENSIYHAFATPFNEQLSVLGPHVPRARKLNSSQKDTEASIHHFKAVLGL